MPGPGKDRLRLDEAGEPSIAVLEFDSIARGYVAADQAVKAAPVRLLLVEAVSPGTLVLMFGGAVAPVEVAHAAALSAAGTHLLDQLRLPRVHPRVIESLRGPGRDVGEALGILECRTVAAGILAADLAAKATPVHLLEIQAARGIGGKTTVILTGSVADVEASLEAGGRGAESRQGLVNREIIARAHADLGDYLAARWGTGPA